MKNLLKTCGFWQSTIGYLHCIGVLLNHTLSKYGTKGLNGRCKADLDIGEIKVVRGKAAPSELITSSS